jgi:hypothetical protein
MTTGKLEDASLELLWSAWTELGVPGVVRKHRTVALDPEPLIIFTPVLSAHDPRLLEQASIWCERHGHVVSKTRLDGLERRAPSPVASSFHAFASSLGGAAASWKKSQQKEHRAAASVEIGRPPLERQALARLRMRSLAGTGARADLLCELVGAAGRWTSATDLEFLGYTRRYLSEVLAELTAARLTVERSGKGPAAFRLRDPRNIETLVDAEGLLWPNWAALLSLAWELVELEKSASQSAALAPVRTNDAREELRRLALANGLHEPPVSTGEAAWPDVLRWGSTLLRHWPANS